MHDRHGAGGGEGPGVLPGRVGVISKAKGRLERVGGMAVIE